MEEFFKVLFVRKVVFWVSRLKKKKNLLFLLNTTFNIFLEIKFIC